MSKPKQTAIKRRDACGVDQLLRERGETHGEFTDVAHFSRSLKAVVREATDSEKHYSEIQSEALEMIAHKIARIYAGNPDCEDHWRDIAGVATLVADRLTETNNKEKQQ